MYPSNVQVIATTRVLENFVNLDKKAEVYE